MEFARNVLGFEDAAHAELDPDAERPVVVQLPESLAGKDETVYLTEGTLAASVYRASFVTESYRCGYGAAGAYVPQLEAGGLVFSGHDEHSDVRVAELPSYPLFLLTLYVPQLRSTYSIPHPIIRSFARAAGKHSGRP